MFQKAVIRLTLWYALAVIVLSGCFSYALYQASTHELNQLQNRQEQLVEDGRGFLPPGFEAFNQQRINQIEDSKHNIAIELGYFDLLIIILGIGGSYLLAKRTLQPIEEAVLAQDRFTADASHELRTPLTAIKTEIEVALRDKDMTVTEARALSESTLQEVAKLESLTNGLLKLAKHESEKVIREPVIVDKLVATAISRVAPLIEKNEVTVTHETPGIVLGEEWAYTELLTILLDNAVKYSPKGSVHIRTQDERGHLLLTVTDTGVGMKASDLPHIFDRFYRVDSSRSKNKVEGYGLGLSIAKKIVDTNHGKIWATSIVGKGSTFHVRLPSALSQSTAVA